VIGRRSKLALVLICVNIDGAPYLLFHRHRKWGDWSLIGGHVEPSEEGNWLIAATREAGEELAPLRPCVDFVIEPFPMAPIEWGPVPSRTKDNIPTIYIVQYYWLRFLRDPATALAQLDPRDFVLIRLSDIDAAQARIGVSDTFERFAASLGNHIRDLPCSWSAPIHGRALPRGLERVTGNDS